MPLFALFNMPALNFDSSGLIWVAVAVAIYFALSKFGAGESVSTGLAKLPERAGTLIRFIDSLGMPFLAPVLKNVADRNWSKIPDDINVILDTMDDKERRRGLLDTMFYKQLGDRLTDSTKREEALREIEKALGVTITRPTV